MFRQLGSGTGVRVILSRRLANLDSVQIPEEIRLGIARVNGIEFVGCTLIREVLQHRVRAVRQHVRQAARMRQQVTDADGIALVLQVRRSEEHTSELQSLMRISYAVFCLKKKN